MSIVILTTGRRAENPYSIDNLGIRVWSVEELCYCFRENAFLLDSDIVSKDLVSWLAQECDLKELADSLKPLLNKEGVTSAFVVKILNYVGYCRPEEVSHIGKTLQTGADLTDYEKKKRQGDFLFENGKYDRAIAEYDRLLVELPEQEKELKAAILHNKAVVLARLFLFEKAAYFFKQAYTIVPDEGYYRDYLAAMRMLYDDKKYISFVAELPDAYEVSLKLEREVDGILEEWEKSDELRNLEELPQLKEIGETGLYYDEIHIRTRNMKEAYRECTNG